MLGIEPLNRYETSLINTVEQALEALGPLLGNGVGLALDTYHLHIEERSVAAAVRSVTESASKAKTLVDEVKLGNQEQARGIEQIAKGIVQMEQVTQSTAAQAEESAAASSELFTQAQAVGLVARRLRVLIGSDTSEQD